MTPSPILPSNGHVLRFPRNGIWSKSSIGLHIAMLTYRTMNKTDCAERLLILCDGWAQGRLPGGAERA